MTQKQVLLVAQLLRRQLRGDRPAGPSGMCFAWNIQLAVKLRDEGEPVRFMRGYFRTDDGQQRGHYWCLTDHGILDITGSQFNHLCKRKLPVVAILPTDDPAYEATNDETERLAAY